jgi:PAS domain S-box-containing protein
MNYTDGVLIDELGNSLLNSIGDAVLITEAEPFDLPGPRILYVNAAFSQMTGYPINEVLGLSPRILQYEDTKEEDRAAIRRGLEQWKPFRQQMLNQRKDGTRFIVELSISPVKDETGWWTHWICLQRDISQQRETESLIQRSRVAIEKMGMGTWSLDLIQNELVWDDQMYKLYELDRNRFSGDYEAWQCPLHPDDLARGIQAVGDATNGVRNFDIEFRILTAANNTKYIHAKADVIRD